MALGEIRQSHCPPVDLGGIERGVFPALGGFADSTDVAVRVFHAVAFEVVDDLGVGDAVDELFDHLDVFGMQVDRVPWSLGRRAGAGLGLARMGQGFWV